MSRYEGFLNFFALLRRLILLRVGISEATPHTPNHAKRRLEELGQNVFIGRRLLFAIVLSLGALAR